MAVRRSAPLDDSALYAEYPFLPGADALLGDLAVSVGDLLADPVYARARELGRARVRAAADDPTGGVAVEELARASPTERFLSFYFARLLVSAAPAPVARRRWAVAEAKQAWGRWRSAPLPELTEVAARLDRPLHPVADGVALSLVDYLHLAAPIREAEFRLARQRLVAGRVLVERDRASRLLQEAVRATLGVPVALGEDVVATVREREREFFDELASRLPLPPRPGAAGVASLKPDRFPPCIRRMQRVLHAGENLSHAGRFALAAYLHRAGADFDTIVDAYRGAPDFDEAITRYQVEHITQRDGGAGYIPPE